ERMMGKRRIVLFVIQFAVVLSVSLPTFAQITISDIAPSPAGRGTTVVVSGSGFSSTPASNAVVFSAFKGSASGVVTAASSTNLSVVVPATAATGKVYVQVGSVTSNQFNFKVANLPPVVNAGPNQIVTLAAGASLSGTVTDDGLPNGTTLQTTWSKFSGPDAVTFANANALNTTATFSTAGTYVLRLTAS